MQMYFFPSLLFLAHILPPCASIMLLEMNNPNPVPVSDFAETLKITGDIFQGLYLDRYPLC